MLSVVMQSVLSECVHARSMSPSIRTRTKYSRKSCVPSALRTILATRTLSLPYLASLRWTIWALGGEGWRAQRGDKESGELSEVGLRDEC